MFRPLAPATLSLLSVCALGASSLASPPDFDATAKTLVERCAAIHEGDRVIVGGRLADIRLLESICVEVRKQGAFPLLTISTDRLAKRMLDEVPEKYDSQVDDFTLKMAPITSAVISVDSVETEGLFADAPPARMAARAKAGMDAENTMLKANIRRVSLGNGLFPTKSTAAMYGLTEDKLAEIFWAGVNTDYSALQSTGEKVKSSIESGRVMHITNPNGTDLTFQLSGKPCNVSDGVISKDDLAKGGPACQVWLPAGEVYGIPAPGTATGRVVFDRVFFQGKEIIDLTMSFTNGAMTDMSAKSGIEPLKALYEAASGAAASGKNEFTFFDFGINPDVKIPSGSKLQSWVPAGMVTVGIGNNAWAGGQNSSSFGFSSFLPNSTVTIDNKPLIEKGNLRN